MGPFPRFPFAVAAVAAAALTGCAERVEAPTASIAVVTDRLHAPDAEEMLAACRALDVDLGLAVAEAADPEAQRRVVATKVRWLRPLDIAHLDL